MTIHPVILTPTIVGKALYLELVNNPDAPEGSLGYWYKNAVKQVLMLPEHLDSVGIAQPAQIWTRIVSAHSPRSQWDSQTISNSRLIKKPTKEQLDSNENTYHFSYEFYTTDELAEMTDKEKHQAKVNLVSEKMKGTLVDNYTVKDAEGNSTSEVSQLWIIRDSKPLAVEVTDEDMANARSGKTPQAVIRRIQKTRVASGFPEKIV
jgi:hypothetical protein